MKNWNWKQWTALCIIFAVVITLISLHFAQPAISYAFAEVIAAGGFILGGIVGYMIKGKTI